MVTVQNKIKQSQNNSLFKNSFGEVEELSDEEGLDTYLHNYVQYLKVQDRAILGRLTQLVQIRDPCNGHIIASIRDPKVGIVSYKSEDGVIDLQKSIDTGVPPIFNRDELPMSFDCQTLGWHQMLDLIKSKEKKKQFWEFIERLSKVRETYN